MITKVKVKEGILFRWNLTSTFSLSPPEEPASNIMASSNCFQGSFLGFWLDNVNSFDALGTDISETATQLDIFD